MDKELQPLDGPPAEEAGCLVAIGTLAAGGTAAAAPEAAAASLDRAASNAPDASIGLRGDLGGTGGGTLVLDPAGLSHKTAGKFR